MPYFPYVPPTTSVSGQGGIVISTSGSTLYVVAPQITDYEPIPLLNGLTTSFVPSIGTWHFEPFHLPGQLSGGRLNRLYSFGGTASILRASSGNFSSATTGSRSVSFTYGNSVALYSRGAGTNSTRLESFWSNSFSVGLAHSVSVSSSAGTTMRVTEGGTISYVASIGSNGAYTTSSFSSSTNTTSAAASIGTTAMTSVLNSIRNMLSGNLIIPVGFNTTIPAGNYWLAQAYSTASTTAGTSADVWSFVGQTALQGNTHHSNRIWGQTASTSGSQAYPGQGIYSVASAAPPSTAAFSDIRTIAQRQYFNIVNSTI